MSARYVGSARPSRPGRGEARRMVAGQPRERVYVDRLEGERPVGRILCGDEAADELARWAIDALCGGELPARRGTHVHAVKVPWSDVERGREIMEQAGIDWRELHARQAAAYRERSERVGERQRLEKIAAQRGGQA